MVVEREGLFGKVGEPEGANDAQDLGIEKVMLIIDESAVEVEDRKVREKGIGVGLLVGGLGWRRRGRGSSATGPDSAMVIEPRGKG